jgi:hypothetical protein
MADNQDKPEIARSQELDDYGINEEHDDVMHDHYDRIRDDMTHEQMLERLRFEEGLPGDGSPGLPPLGDGSPGLPPLGDGSGSGHEQSDNGKYDFIDGDLAYVIKDNGGGDGANQQIIQVHYLGTPATILKIDVENSANSSVDFVMNQIHEASTDETGLEYLFGYDVEGASSWSGSAAGLDPALGIISIPLDADFVAGVAGTGIGPDAGKIAATGGDHSLNIQASTYYDIIALNEGDIATSFEAIFAYNEVVPSSNGGEDPSMVAKDLMQSFFIALETIPQSMTGNESGVLGYTLIGTDDKISNNADNDMTLVYNDPFMGTEYYTLDQMPIFNISYTAGENGWANSTPGETYVIDYNFFTSEDGTPGLSSGQNAFISDEFENDIGLIGEYRISAEQGENWSFSANTTIKLASDYEPIDSTGAAYYDNNLISFDYDPPVGEIVNQEATFSYSSAEGYNFASDSDPSAPGDNGGDFSSGSTPPSPPVQDGSGSGQTSVGDGSGSGSGQTSVGEGSGSGSGGTQDYWTHGHEGDEAVDGSKVIQYMEDQLVAIGGTSYLDPKTFVNDGVNSINTAYVADLGMYENGTVRNNEIGFTNVETSTISSNGEDINTVSMDVVLPNDINNLTGLHFDLKGFPATNVEGLNGVSIDAFRADSSSVIVDPGELHTNGWNGGPVIRLTFDENPQIDGNIGDIVSSIIDSSYIQTYSDDGWITVSDLGWLGQVVTDIDAGSGDDYVAGGVGGYTVNGGDGFDMYLAAPASLENIYEGGNVISQNGVIIDLSASRVTYLEDNTHDIVENTEYFMGTTGDDIFVGTSRYNSLYDIQAFNGSGGSDEIFGAVTKTDEFTLEEIDILTVVDYSSMQGGQGAVFILDGSSVMSSADTDGNLSYTVVQNAAGDNWNNWLPYNEGTFNGDNISTKSTYNTNADGASVILDTFGDVDIAFDVDHYIGSDEADIFFGSNEDDTFDAATGTGNFMSGGDGVDELIVSDLDEGEDDDLDLSTMQISRAGYSYHNHTDVDVSDVKFVSDNDNDHFGGDLYRIDFADVNDLHDFIEPFVSNDVSSGYSLSAEYALFIRTNLDPSGMTKADVMFDSANQKIDVTGTDISILDGLDGQLVLAEQVGKYSIQGKDDAGFSSYSTIIENVEKVTFTSDDVEYLGTTQLTGSQEHTYEILTGGQGDLGDMLYVTTGQKLESTTGVGEYIAGPGFITGDVYYSGNHRDFDRHSDPLGWSTSVTAAYTTLDGQELANIWYEEIAQFFVWYDADGAGGEDGYEIAVKYQNGGVDAWGIDNKQFDTFQTVQVDQTLADAIKLQFGDDVDVEIGSYRVLYEAAFSDIEAIVGSNAVVNDWDFDITPSSSRSTFYIQVGGDATGENGNSGVTDTEVTNVKVERVVDDVTGGFKWSVNPQAEILVNLPEVTGATNGADVMISGDAAETIEAGRGSDVMMGRGGSDNYKINEGDTLETDADGNLVAGDYGVAGDVINEIGGSSEDKSDSITLSSAENIDQLTFTRTHIKNEDYLNTLKIEVDYDQDGNSDDTLFVFDQYNQNLGFRSVEQLLLDDGWDSNEIWNLVAGDFSADGKVDEYIGSSGQDILMAGLASSSVLYGGNGQDVMVGEDIEHDGNRIERETIFELGTRDDDGAWDQIADIIQGFGSGDQIDLSNLGIADADGLEVEGNNLFMKDGVDQDGDDVIIKIAEFSNFIESYSLDQLTVDGAIIYSVVA